MQKTNPLVVDTIIKLKKTNPQIAKILSKPRKLWPSVNLNQINDFAKEGEQIFVAGKVLSSGELNKKIKIISWGASENAIKKIKKSKSEFSNIKNEIKFNKELKGVKILE